MMETAMITCTQAGSYPGQMLSGPTRLGPLTETPLQAPSESQSDPNLAPHNQSCAGCGGRIEDRVMLNALDRLWHTGCLKCSACRATLNDLGNSFFSKGNMILCRKDYIKMFGTTGQCAGCGQGIPADELVMRCQTSVYHVRCFTCVQCHARLQPGDKFSFVNGSLFCEHEFPKIFGGQPGSNPSGTGTGRGRQKKVDSRRYPLPVC